MRHLIWTLLLALSAVSCDGFLDLTPKGATTLDNLDDLEYLLNGTYGNTSHAFYGNLCVLTNESYGKRTTPWTIIAGKSGLDYILMAYDEEIDRLAYTNSDGHYDAFYSHIVYMNVLLDKLGNIPGEADRKERLAAEAKVMRAYWHYLLVNIFAKQYDEATAAANGGIPYVEKMNLESENPKLTLQEVYEHLLADCSEETIKALPDEAVNIVRPGKAMGYALLAKIYLQMKKYDEALKYVNEALKYNDHIDNRLPVMSEFLYNREKDDASVIFFSGENLTDPFGCIVSQETARLFEEGDILMNYGRYTLQEGTEDPELWNIKACEQYKTGIEGEIYMWQGRNSTLPVAGITSDQLYYIKGECLIRGGHYQEGLDEVNKVRKYRIDPAVYQDLSASTEREAMEKLMKAKRIECLFTYNTFFDMKRWNTEEAYKQTITRTIGDKTYTLRPDSPLWVFPFPGNAVKYNSTLTQNY